MKLKKFNEMLDPLGSWMISNSKKEIKHFGFLDSDLLSTIIINGDKATLYLFNWGNYGKVRNYLSSISDDDFGDIENWLCDRFRDENMIVEPIVNGLESIDKSQVTDSDILSEYPDNEIGDMVIKLNIILK